MPSPLIDATLAAGERLLAAIQTEDFGRTAELAAARGVLMDRLLAETTPAMHTEEDRRALTAQHRALTGLLNTQEGTLRSAFATSRQHRRAHASYHAPPSRPSVLRAVHG
ncbi:MAG: flagellar protein FliT [Bacteroidota bacterium]